MCVPSVRHEHVRVCVCRVCSASAGPFFAKVVFIENKPTVRTGHTAYGPGWAHTTDGSEKPAAPSEKGTGKRGGLAYVGVVQGPILGVGSWLRCRKRRGWSNTLRGCRTRRAQRSRNARTEHMRNQIAAVREGGLLGHLAARQKSPLKKYSRFESPLRPKIGRPHKPRYILTMDYWEAPTSLS